MEWGLFNRLLIGNVSRRACTKKEREREAVGPSLERRREDDVGTMMAGSEGRGGKQDISAGADRQMAAGQHDDGQLGETRQLGKLLFV